MDPLVKKTFGGGLPKTRHFAPDHGLAWVQCRRVLGLIKADITATWQFHFHDLPPGAFLDFREREVFPCERAHFGLQVVAYEKKFVRPVLFRWVKCRFGRR